VTGSFVLFVCTEYM